MGFFMWPIVTGNPSDTMNRNHDFEKARRSVIHGRRIISSLGHCPYIGFRIKAYALTDRAISIISELNVGR
jgi:hypothetical protein